MTAIIKGVFLIDGEIIRITVNKVYYKHLKLLFMTKFPDFRIIVAMILMFFQCFIYIGFIFCTYYNQCFD